MKMTPFRNWCVICVSKHSQHLLNGWSTSRVLIQNLSCTCLIGRIPLPKHLYAIKLFQMTNPKAANNVQNVTRYFPHMHLCWFIRGNTQGKDHMDVNIVIRASMWKATYWGIWGLYIIKCLTQGKWIKMRTVVVISIFSILCVLIKVLTFPSWEWTVVSIWDFDTLESNTFFFKIP